MSDLHRKRHHPADALLADYAGGRMRPGFDLIVGAHLETCGRCRGRVAGFEAAAAELLNALPPAEMSADALPHLLARLEREPAPESQVQETAPAGRLLDRLPLGRRRVLAPGVWVQPVKVPHTAGDRIYLLRVGAGLRGINHAHAGTELTLVLEGSLHDGDAIYRVGDISEHDAEVTHQPRAGSEGPCLCLIASEGRLKPLDLIGHAIRALANV